MRRLKATDKVGTFTLFQESYHRESFKKMHVSGPKSDFDYRVLTQVGCLGDVEVPISTMQLGCLWFSILAQT